MSQLSLAVSKEITETLAGHSGYLTGNYRRYTPAQLREEYLKGEHTLYIEAVKEIRETATTTKKELIAVKDDQHKANSQMISLLIEKDRLREQNAELSKRLGEQEAVINTMEHAIRKLARIADPEGGLEKEIFDEE